jgi:hypothetical protein
MPHLTNSASASFCSPVEEKLRKTAPKCTIREIDFLALKWYNFINKRKSVQSVYDKLWGVDYPFDTRSFSMEEELVEITVQVYSDRLKHLMKLLNIKDEGEAIRKVIHQAVDFTSFDNAIKEMRRRYRQKKKEERDQARVGGISSGDSQNEEEVKNE